MDSIDTTRSPSGAMSTTTRAREGTSPYSGMDLGSFLIGASRIKDKRKQIDEESAPAPRYAESAAPRYAEAPAYVPQLGAQQSSPNYAETRKRPVTRMRRVQRRSAIPVFGMEGNGLTYDDVPETQLADGSWSLDAVHGTLAGNEAAAMKGPNDITKLIGMNFSGLGGGTWGLDKNDPRLKGKG